MAKVTGIIDRNVIRRFKGKLDFYGRRGVTYVRSWPHQAPYPASTSQILAQCHYINAMDIYRCTPLWMRDQYASLTTGMWWSRRDYFYKLYFGTIDPWPPSAWDHHPPQPAPCPGGNGHYWALLWNNHHTVLTSATRLHFWFNQPLHYVLHWRREPPWYGTQVSIRSNIRCELGRVAAYAGVETQATVLTSFTGNHKYLQFSVGPPPYSGGWWFGYIEGFHPTTHHPALSKTPWFSWYIPMERPVSPGTNLPGISFIENYVTQQLPEYNAPRPPKTTFDLGPCLNPTIH